MSFCPIYRFRSTIRWNENHTHSVPKELPERSEGLLPPSFGGNKGLYSLTGNTEFQTKFSHALHQARIKLHVALLIVIVNHPYL